MSADPLRKRLFLELAGGELECGQHAIVVGRAKLKPIEVQKTSMATKAVLLLPSVNGWLRAIPKA